MTKGDASCLSGTGGRTAGSLTNKGMACVDWALAEGPTQRQDPCAVQLQPVRMYHQRHAESL